MNDLDFMLWELWCIVIEIEEFEFDKFPRKRSVIIYKRYGKGLKLCSQKEKQTKRNNRNIKKENPTQNFLEGWVFLLDDYYIRTLAFYVL